MRRNRPLHVYSFLLFCAAFYLSALAFVLEARGQSVSAALAGLWAFACVGLMVRSGLRA